MSYFFTNPSYPIICGSFEQSESFVASTLNSLEEYNELVFKNAQDLFCYFFSKEEYDDLQKKETIKQ